MTPVDDDAVAVAGKADVLVAGRRARRVAGEVGFEDAAIEEVALAVHELASNIVKHAGEGAIALDPVADGDCRGVEVRAHDSGPGIADVDRAVVDGYSTAGGLGGGLGTVLRLMDDVVIDADGPPEAGATVTATRWEGTRAAGPESPPLAVGAATRPKPGREAIGDAFLVEHGDGETLVGVIDGLGHGRAAHEAADRARRHVLTHADRPLAELFDGVDRTCREGRGVVMLLARFDWAAETVALGTVGNVALKVCGAAEPRRLVPERGVLGANASTPTVREWDWDPDAVVVIHTDGLRSNWRCDEVPLGAERPVTGVAGELRRSLSNGDDDATVLVVRGVDR